MDIIFNLKQQLKNEIDNSSMSCLQIVPDNQHIGKLSITTPCNSKPYRRGKSRCRGLYYDTRGSRVCFI